MCTSVARFSHRFTYPSAGEQTRHRGQPRTATLMLAHLRVRTDEPRENASGLHSAETLRALPSSLACARESKRNPHHTPVGAVERNLRSRGALTGCSAYALRPFVPWSPSLIAQHASRDAPRPSQPPTLFKLHRPSPTFLSHTHGPEPTAAPPLRAFRLPAFPRAKRPLWFWAVRNHNMLARAGPTLSERRTPTPNEQEWCARFAVWVNPHYSSR